MALDMYGELVALVTMSQEYFFNDSKDMQQEWVKKTNITVMFYTQGENMVALIINDEMMIAYTRL